MMATLSFLFYLYQGVSILGVYNRTPAVVEITENKKSKKKHKLQCNCGKSSIGIIIGVYIGLLLGFYIGWGFNIGFWVGLGLGIGFAVIFGLILGLILGLYKFKTIELFEINKKYKRPLRIFDYVDLMFGLWYSFGLLFTFLQILDPDQITNFDIDLGSFVGIILSLWEGHYFTFILTTSGFTQFIVAKFWAQFFVYGTLITSMAVRLLVLVTFGVFLRKNPGVALTGGA